MRLLMTCMTCRFDPSEPREFFVNVGFRDDMRYELVCNRGHKTVTMVQEAKYEILFEIGVNALIDGYYREAVASFASALERFFEFAIEILLQAGGVPRDEVKSTWKHVSSSSERQLGAFALLWLRQFRESPALLNSNRTAFRNDIVHKGRIPERNEAIEFGNAVLSVILPKLTKLRLDLPDSVREVVFHSLAERRTKADASHIVGTMTIPTIFRMAESEPADEHTVTSHLDFVLRQRRTAIIGGA